MSGLTSLRSLEKAVFRIIDCVIAVNRIIQEGFGTSNCFAPIGYAGLVVYFSLGSGGFKFSSSVEDLSGPRILFLNGGLDRPKFGI